MDVKSRFGRTTLAEDVQAFLELLRKWQVAHGVRCVFIWAREWGRTHGEHLHIGFHLVDDLAPAFTGHFASVPHLTEDSLYGRGLSCSGDETG